MGEGKNATVGFVHTDCSSRPNCVDVSGRGLHRVYGGRPAAHTCAVRQARDGPQSNGRADDLSASAGEFGRRDSADFREFAAYVPADFGAFLPEKVSVL